MTDQADDVVEAEHDGADAADPPEVDEHGAPDEVGGVADGSSGGRAWASRSASDVPRGGLAALGAVAVVAVFSATWRIDRSDWKLDESVYAQAGWYLVHGEGDANYGHPPLAKVAFGLAQVAFGRNLTAVRSVAALGFLLSVAVLFVLGRRMAGWWTGVAAAGLFAALPRSMVVGQWFVADLRIDRYGLLESVAGPLLMAGLGAGWLWITGGSRRWALAAGGLVGLAGAAKLNSLVVLVAIALVALAYRWGRRGVVLDVVALGTAAVAGFLVPFAVYVGDAAAKVEEVLRFPGERAESGHILVLGGEVYSRSPWWANLQYQWKADGPWLSLALVAGLVLAVLARRRPAVVYLLVTTGALVAASMASPVALPHYRAAWTAPLLLLVAIGVTDHLRAPRDGLDTVLRGAGVAALAVLVVAAAVSLADLATLPEGDYRRMAAAARADGVDPDRIEQYSEAVAAYFPHAVDSLAPFSDGSQPAQMVVLDPSLTDASNPLSVEQWRNWARGWGLVPHDFGRLEAWWAEP